MNERFLMTRRELLMAGGALALGALLPAGRARAEAGKLVAATYPGTWSEAHRNVLKPAFQKRVDAGVTQSIILGTDQVARLAAAKGQTPPFDVAIFDPPQVLDAVRQGLIAEYPVAQSPHYAELLPVYQDRWGPKVSMQVIGLAYNPERIRTPPKRWDDLWDPQYRGRVGMTALNSQLGLAFLAELNRLRGGSSSDFEPAFRALRELLPALGAVAANLGAFATLWQQEQIDIAPYNFNFVQTLKAKGVPVEFVVPETGAVAWHTSLHVVAGTTVPELAVQYIDTHLDPLVQAAMMQPPYDVIPTNGKVALAGAVTQSVAKTQDALAALRGVDWAVLTEQRSALIERFNREIRV